MDQRTVEHLDLARTNHSFADRLSQLLNADRAECTWAIVSAFYSAVHYVNAYLWETQRVAPRNHFQRSNLVSNDLVLQLLAAEYKQLQDQAQLSRYEPTFRASSLEVRASLKALTMIRTVIETALSSIS